ncbi:hypothetical protein APY04_2877 [Hyphomicrobium sulfonivorans]|uniref:Uncharacterized protein n=1 Tax=Hyphomicrobium sulfonivorans TaxID=121290 RepID=A0A125NU17_HYPSL|nr:hypothetical protein APY04_2877 [Hyphomicrobium sulfonivorans]
MALAGKLVLARNRRAKAAADKTVALPLIWRTAARTPLLQNDNIDNGRPLACISQALGILI